MRLATESPAVHDQERVLIVEDDDTMRAFLEQALGRMGLSVAPVASAEEALEAAPAFRPHLALLDVRLGGMDGITLLEHLGRSCPECARVVMTAHGTVETAIAAMRAGAEDFLLKPFTLGALEKVVDKSLGVARLVRENRQLRARLKRRRRVPELIGQTPIMQRLRDLVRTVAQSPATVLVEGESGTGKELVAHALHVWGPRRERPLVKVNCAALPAGLMESELFGHARGAFTGATQTIKGKFELADGGTLMLDEISEMEAALQPKLLRSLQEKEFYRVGGSDPIRVDVRIVATTNANLGARVRESRFREDLYYRLRVVPVHVPPLRERADDIPLLAQHFLTVAAADHGKHFERIDAAAVAGLMNHDWPGNVRELENMIQRAVVIAPGPILAAEHLLWDTMLPAHGRASPKSPPVATSHADAVAGPACAGGPPSAGGLPSSGGAPSSGGSPLAGGAPSSGGPPSAHALAAAGLAGDGWGSSPQLSLRELERLWILRALEQEAGNKSRAARRLGISVRTIRNKLRAYGEEAAAAG